MLVAEELGARIQSSLYYITHQEIPNCDLSLNFEI